MKTACTTLFAAMLLGLGFIADSNNSKGIILPPVTHRVGAFGPGCDFSSLQDAIEASAHRDRILVSNDAIHGVDAVISHSLTISGGFASCTASSAGDTPTQIVAAGKATPITAFANGTVSNPRIILDTLSISNGQAVSGGGIYADGQLQLVLRDITVSDNVATTDGGGVMLFDGVAASMEGTVRLVNNVAGRGGGMHCDGASIEVVDTLDVEFNTADQAGGASLSDCALTAHSGSQVSINGNSGFTHVALLLSNDSAAHFDGSVEVRFNDATSGSIITVREESILHAEGPSTLIQSNTSGLIGASAITATSGARAILVSSHPECTLDLANTALESFCVAIAGNRADSSLGAVFATSGAMVTIDRALIFLNQSAGQGAQFAYAFDEADITVQSSLVFEHNNGTGSVMLASDATVTVVSTTFANNQTPGDLVRASGASGFVELHAIATYENSGSLLALDSGGLAAGTCLYLEQGSSASGLAIAGRVTSADMAEPDLSLRDFRPSANSVLLDACSDAAYPLPDRDVVSQLRPIDLPEVDNGAGTYDAGAFELPVNILFSDGFESTAMP